MHLGRFCSQPFNYVYLTVSCSVEINCWRSKHENVSIAFHFTADEGKAMDRVNDYKTICKSLSLSPEKQGDAKSG